ncbi:MAG: peptidoglycan-binding domain-containing protein [Cyanobacteriota bacterium]
MESLAYLNLAIAHDNPPIGESLRFNPSPLSLNKLSFLCKSSLYLVTFSLIVGTTNPAWAILQEGDRGEEVVVLQQHLKKLGYLQATPTGYFGPMTENALIQFQRSQQLTPDGIYGSQTQQALVSQINQQTNHSASPNAILRRGDRGESVRLLQEQLGIAGFFTGNATGFYGPQTESAVMRFQAARELTVDGIAGTQTRRALPAVGGETATPIASTSTSNPNFLTVGSRGQAVAELQKRLKALGYFEGPITGYFGEQTQNAVIRFQQEQELRPDGIVGVNTLDALAETVPKESVRTIQQRLQSLGYYNGSIDGIWGQGTQQALEAAQRANNIGL